MRALRLECRARPRAGGDVHAGVDSIVSNVAGVNTSWLTVLQDGEIVRHWDFQAGMTPPLDNAVTP